MDNKKLAPLVFLAVASVVIIFALSNSIFLTIQAGERGVMFRPFSTGLDKENILGAGFHIKAPWNDIYIYDVKEQTTNEPMDILDKNGLNINVDVTLRFNPIYNQIGHLHENIGVNYVHKLVSPVIRSSVRQIMGRYTAEEIYSTQRGQVEAAIKEETAKVLAEKNISMIDLLIRSINLPSEIKNAIESKLKQQQEALAYKFKLEKEKSEAERKRIAADGEATANKIINSSLTDNLLKMRGIEATTTLSESENSKVIIIGSGKDGLPLILGNN